MHMLRASKCKFLLAAFAGFSLLSLTPAFAQDPIPPPLTPGNLVTNQNTLRGYVRAKASPDECYAGIAAGVNIPYDFINQIDPTNPCVAGKRPRTNQSYVWGIVLDGNYIYFGTTSNGQCITHGGIVSDPATLKPYETDSWACQFQNSPYVPSPLPARIGDFRPPRFYIYDRTTHAITDITPKAPASTSNRLGMDPLWQTLRGARASALVGTNYVVVGGPALAADGRLNFFAWDKTQMKWVAKTQFTGYDNIRRFVDYNGTLYAGVGRSLDGNGSGFGGAVVKLRTNFTTIPAGTTAVPIPTCVACFGLDVVGNLDGEGAYLAVHNNRIFITTWAKPGNAGLFMSPDVPVGAALPNSTAMWTKVWSAEQYDPDPVIASSWAGGAIHSWNGKLYWGTMNVPYSGPGRLAQVHGKPDTVEGLREFLVKGWRATSVFRATGFETGTPTVELLYGENQFHKYTAGPSGTPGTWELVNNAANLTALYGRSGFNNPYNNYIWSMGVWSNKLYVGTMDWSYMASKGSAVVAGISPITKLIPVIGGNGGDLWYFTDHVSAAKLETDTGFGNPTNYGIRNIIPVDSTRMFLGMANAMNLLTTPGSTRNGGWELIEVVPAAPAVRR